MIIITGTPGTGKTSVANELKKLNFKIINFEKRIKKCKLIVGYDKKRKSTIVNEDKLTNCFKYLKRDDVVESHLSHFINPKYVETPVVLKCNPKELRKRLKRKGWNKKKIEENVESEIMDICLNETIENGHDPIVIDTTNKKPREVAEIIKFNHIANILNQKYKVKIKVGNPFKTLVRCILSQRTKDETTEEASKKLFSKLKNYKQIKSASIKEIDKLISKVGFHKRKAGCIKKIAEITNGKIPRNRKVLLSFPCVGKKTADITLSYGFGIPIIAIDVHVNVISRRLGIKGNNYDELQKSLHKLFPENRRLLINKLFVEFGKDVCRTKKPKCKICMIRKWCKFKNKLLQ